MCERNFFKSYDLLHNESFSMQTTLVFLVSTVLFWWGCCNRSVNHNKKPHHRSAISDETGAATAPVNSTIQTAKTAREDAQSPALSKSQSIHRTSVINFDTFAVIQLHIPPTCIQTQRSFVETILPSKCRFNLKLFIKFKYVRDYLMNDAMQWVSVKIVA